MTRKRDAERQRNRERDLDALRFAIEHDGGQVRDSDRRVRRLVQKGWADSPAYTYDLPGMGDATAKVTEAGRKEVTQ